MIPINASLRNPYAPTATLCNGGATQVSKPSKRETEQPIVELVKKNKRTMPGGAFLRRVGGGREEGTTMTERLQAPLFFIFFALTH